MKKVVVLVILLFVLMITNISYATDEAVNQEINAGDTYVLQNELNLRLIPNLSSKSNVKIEKNVEVTVETKIGNWYKITDNNVTGWVTEMKLLANPTQTTQPPLQEEPEPEETPIVNEVQNNVPESKPEEKPAETVSSNRTGIVNVETARVRKSATTSSDIIATLDEDDVVTIIGEENGFYKITTSTITEGYISTTLVKEKNVTSRSSTEDRQEAHVADNTGNTVVEFAKQYLSYPYVLGASSPSTGFDCSGFTRYVFSNFGYTLGRVATDQTSLGAVVELLFYDDAKTKIGHCGIYISGGDFIHSANPTRGVVIDNLNTNSYYSTRFVTARRIY